MKLYQFSHGASLPKLLLPILGLAILIQSSHSSIIYFGSTKTVDAHTGVFPGQTHAGGYIHTSENPLDVDYVSAASSGGGGTAFARVSCQALHVFSTNGGFFSIAATARVNGYGTTNVTASAWATYSARCSFQLDAPATFAISSVSAGSGAPGSRPSGRVELVSQTTGFLYSFSTATASGVLPAGTYSFRTYAGAYAQTGNNIPVGTFSFEPMLHYASISVGAVSTVDADADGLRDDWELTYWPSHSVASANSDRDHTD